MRGAMNRARWRKEGWRTAEKPPLRASSASQASVAKWRKVIAEADLKPE
jgi:hypothetical protein